MKDKAVLLSEIEKEIKVCQKCGLCKTAKNAVPGEGDPNAKIIFIGEAPGANEDIQGCPFVGRAGMLLEFLLHQIGYKRNQVWIGNIIKHRPPDNRDPLPEEITACQPFLMRQLEVLDPKIIVTLGRFSMAYFLPSEKISTARGKLFSVARKNIYPVYHPAAALRNSKMKNDLILDFLKIPSVLAEIENPPNIQKAKQSEDSKSVDQTQKETSDTNSQIRLL